MLCHQQQIEIETHPPSLCRTVSQGGIDSFFFLQFAVHAISHVSGQNLHFARHHHLPHVQIHEVRIQGSLDDPCNNGIWLEVSLCHVSIDPIDNVQGPVPTQDEHVCRCDTLCLLLVLEHDDLRHDGNGLEVNGKRPQDLVE